MKGGVEPLKGMWCLWIVRYLSAYNSKWYEIRLVAKLVGVRFLRIMVSNLGFIQLAVGF